MLTSMPQAARTPIDREHINAICALIKNPECVTPDAISKYLATNLPTLDLNGTNDAGETPLACACAADKNQSWPTFYQYIS